MHVEYRRHALDQALSYCRFIWIHRLEMIDGLLHIMQLVIELDPITRQTFFFSSYIFNNQLLPAPIQSHLITSQIRSKYSGDIQEQFSKPCPHCDSSSFTLVCVLLCFAEIFITY